MNLKILILYYYSPESFVISNKFWITIYDVDNKVYYSLENNDSNNKQIDLIKKTDNLDDPSDGYALFVFNNYTNNNCELIKSKGNVNISGARTYKAIYEIDLTNKENKYCYFKNFVFD